MKAGPTEFLAFVFLIIGLRADVPRPLVRDFIGLNADAGGAHNDATAAQYRPVGRLLRAYHSTAHYLGADTSDPAPFPRSRDGLDWNEAYGAWRDQGWEVDVSLRFEAIEPSRWKNLEADARAYTCAFAREFGPSGPYHVVASVGLGNEPGKWSDTDCTRIFRAMAEGVRKGDPALKIATCNLTSQPSNRWAKNVGTVASLANLFDILTLHIRRDRRTPGPMVRSLPAAVLSHTGGAGLHFFFDDHDEPKLHGSSGLTQIDPALRRSRRRNVPT
jgi:hypothetical protein